MNPELQKHFQELLDDKEGNITRTDIILVCASLEDAPFSRDCLYHKYFVTSKIFANFGDFDVCFSDIQDSKFIEQTKKGGIKYQLTSMGENHLWSKFMGDYIHIQQLGGISIPKGTGIYMSTDIDKSNVQIPKTEHERDNPDYKNPVGYYINNFDNNNADITFMFKSPTEKLILEKLLDTFELLTFKNRRYGNSSLEPVGIFGSLTRESKIEARLEDKLSRIRNISDTKSSEYLDAIRDLRGYLYLYEIALQED